MRGNANIKDYIFVKIPVIRIESIEPVIDNDLEPAICSFFGCGKKLKLVETLCGNKCIDHQGVNMDITKAISI